MTTAVLAPRQSRSVTYSAPMPETLTPIAPETRGAPPAQMHCPACDEEAVIEWRDMVASTSGPVAHVKLRCPKGRHWFLMLEDDLR